MVTLLLAYVNSFRQKFASTSRTFIHTKSTSWSLWHARENFIIETALHGQVLKQVQH
jgi:hypothetical protein